MRSARNFAPLLLSLAWAGSALGLSFSFTYVDDASGTFASRGWLDPNSLFQQNIRAAADLWGAHINSNQTIVVRIDTHSFSARAGGTNSSGRLLYTNSAGKRVWEPGPLTRVLTGSNPGIVWGYDILLGFDSDYLQNFYWFDPQPELRSAPVPSDKGDFMSVVEHEFGHGFGMTGYRDFATGQIPGVDAMLFDDKAYFGGNGNAIAPDGSRNPMFFRGNTGASLYGSDLHLTNKPPGDPNYGQNYFHLSSCSGAGDGLGSTLMNGCVLPNGTRMELTPFDLSVFADLGYPIVAPTGDYNGSHSVDASDYVLWRKTLNQTGIGLVADGNLNNQIDQGDYIYWKSKFGLAPRTGFGPTPADGNFVPEPSLYQLLVVTLFGRFSSRRPPCHFKKNR
jgi:hypothetical protein